MMTCRILVYCISEGDRKLCVKCVVVEDVKHVTRILKDQEWGQQKKQIWIFGW